jgi:hypothetical protein
MGELQLLRYQNEWNHPPYDRFADDEARLSSLSSISEVFCTSEHSQLFFHSHKKYHSQVSLLLKLQSKSISVERPRVQSELNSVLCSRRFPSATLKTD